MENETTEGLPTPEWSMQGTHAQLAARLGDGFELDGPGWYEDPRYTVLIVPPKLGDNDVVIDLLSQLAELFGMGPDGGEREYVCYSWPIDPRPAMRRMLRLGDQTEVAVPQVMRDAWPQLEAAGVELKAWGDAEIARVAMEHGVSPIEIPKLGACPTHFIKKFIENHNGMTAYRINPYVIHVMDAEQQTALAEKAASGRGTPPYVRLLTAGDVGMALSLRPSS